MTERIPDIIIADNRKEKQLSYGNHEVVNYNDKVMSDLAGTIETLPPLELGPISEAPIKPSWHQNEGYIGGDNHPSQYSSRTEFFGGNKIVGNSGIEDLGWAGPENTPRAVPAPAPAPLAAPVASTTPALAPAPAGIQKPPAIVDTPPTPPEKKETPISTPPNGSEIPEQLQQMFINQGGSGMKWEPESRIWRSMREMENEEQAIQKAEEWNKSAPDGKHGNAAQAAGYTYVADGKRVLLRKK